MIEKAKEIIASTSQKMARRRVSGRRSQTYREERQIRSVNAVMVNYYGSIDPRPSGGHINTRMQDYYYSALGEKR